MWIEAAHCQLSSMLSATHPTGGLTQELYNWSLMTFTKSKQLLDLQEVPLDDERLETPCWAGLSCHKRLDAAKEVRLTVEKVVAADKVLYYAEVVEVVALKKPTAENANL